MNSHKPSFDALLAIILGVPEADVHDVGTVPRGPYMRGYALAKKIEAALAAAGKDETCVPCPTCKLLVSVKDAAWRAAAPDGCR